MGLLLGGVGCIVLGTLAGAGYGIIQHVSVGKSAGFGLGGGIVACLGLVGYRAYRDAIELNEINAVTSRTEDAWTAYEIGEVEKAEHILKEQVERCLKKVGQNSKATLQATHALANLCRVRGLWKDAESLYRQVQPLYLRLLGPSAGTGALYHDMALALEGQRRLPEAIAVCRESVGMLEKSLGPEHGQVAEGLAMLGRMLNENKQAEEAVECYARAVEVRGKLVPASDPGLLELLASYARILFQLRRYEATEGYLISLLKQFEEGAEPNYPAQVEALLDLGTLRVEQQRYNEAEDLFVRGLKLLQHYVGPVDRLLQKILDGYNVLASRRAIREVEGVVNLVTLFHGERERIRVILDEKPEWRNSRDATGWGPLQWAAFIGRDDVVRWLLSRGASAEFDTETCMGPLHVAAAWNRREAMLELLAAGAPVDGRGAGGWTPLFWCCHAGRTKLAELLLKKGARVDVPDDQGNLPLHIAAGQGTLATVTALLGAGANVNTKASSTGRTPLHFACSGGHIAVSECLVFNGADLQAKDAWGDTPLNLAEKGKHKLLVRAMRAQRSAGLGKGK